MKIFFSHALVACMLLFASLAFSQPRNAGKLVVPKGFENVDSLRFGLFNIYHGRDLRPIKADGMALTNAAADSAMANFDLEWGDVQDDYFLGGKRKMITCQTVLSPGYPYYIYHPQLSFMPQALKQRTYYALPSRLPYFADNGYFWRYNDANGINKNSQSYNNTYDANDISPYSEYPKNDTLVNQTLDLPRFCRHSPVLY